MVTVTVRCFALARDGDFAGMRVFSRGCVVVVVVVAGKLAQVFFRGQQRQTQQGASSAHARNGTWPASDMSSEMLSWEESLHINGNLTTGMNLEMAQ